MSNTRRAAPGSSFRQEKYASSPEFELGLNAVLVAKRCSILTDPKEIELIWFLQYLSHQPGSLKKVSEDILSKFHGRLGTPAMHKVGRVAGDYKAPEVRCIRDEPGSPFDHNDFLLKGEKKTADELSLLTDFLRPDDPPQYRASLRASREAYEKELRDAQPISYPVERFTGICLNLFEKKVPDLLKELCLNPAVSSSDFEVPFFENLWGALCDLAADHAKVRLAGIVITEIGRKVLGTLEYAEQQKSLVLIEGNARTGKSFITGAWCEAFPGRRRYVQVPSSNDLTVFFRAIAKALGMSASYTLKAHDLRARIGDVLQTCQLTLVFDEAHYLFPTTNFRGSLPHRINWMLTELVNAGVPVALVSTPQFTATQKVIEQNTHWASEQLMGRISRYMPLPERLEKQDLDSVARYHLPEGDSKSIEALVAYARASRKYLAGIEHATKEARHEAKLQGRDAVFFDDIRHAIETSVMPSDRALEAAVAPASKGIIKRLSIPPATPLQTPLSSSSRQLPKRVDSTFSSGDVARENISEPSIADL